MNTQYRKNLKAVLEASKSYCDKRIDDLEWQIGTYNYDVATDSNVARIKTLPSDTYKSQIDYIGGKTVKYNQLVQNGNFESASGWNAIDCSMSVSNNEITITEQNDGANVKQVGFNFINGHKYLFVALIKSSVTTNTNVMFYDGTSQYLTITDLTSSYKLYAKIFTSAQSINGGQLQLGRLVGGLGNEVVVVYKSVELINLTDKFGAGNEPSDVATAITLLKANGYRLDGTDTYSTGSLKHAVVSGVKYEAVNLLNIADKASTTINGITYKIENGVISISGSVSSSYSPQYLFVEMPLANNIPSGTYSSNWFNDTINNNLYCYYGDIDGRGDYTLAKFLTITNASASGVMANGIAQIRLRFEKNYTYNLTIKPMLVRGSTAPSTYIPYVAPITKAIPSEVLADVRYGLGFDDTNYNHLDNDGHLRGSYVKYTFTGNETYTYSSSGNRATINTNLSELSIDGTTNAITDSDLSIVANNYSIDGISIGTYNGKLVFLVRKNGVITDATTASNYMVGKTIVYPLAQSFDIDYSQYFDTNWNKVDLDNKYATCEMVCENPIDMPNSITNLIKEVKA